MLDTWRSALWWRSDDSPDVDLDEETTFTVLSAARRRAIVRELTETGAEYDLDSLTKAICYRLDGEHPDATRRKAIYVSLYQHHLPTLEEAGAIRATEEYRQITAIDETHYLRTILDAAD